MIARAAPGRRIKLLFVGCEGLEHWRGHPLAQPVGLVDLYGEAGAPDAAFSPPDLLPGCPLYADLAEALAAAWPDAAVVSVPGGRKTTVDAEAYLLSKGVDVIAKKLRLTGPSDRLRLKAAAEAGPGRLIVGEHYRYLPQVGRLRQLLGERRLGNVWSVTWRCHLPVEAYEWMRAYRHLALEDLAYHHFGVLHDLCGFHVKSVYAHSFEPAHSRTGSRTVASVLAETAEGYRLNYQTVWRSLRKPFGYFGEVVVEGEEGSACVSDEGLQLFSPFGRRKKGGLPGVAVRRGLGAARALAGRERRGNAQTLAVGRAAVMGGVRTGIARDRSCRRFGRDGRSAGALAPAGGARRRRARSGRPGSRGRAAQRAPLAGKNRLAEANGRPSERFRRTGPACTTISFAAAGAADRRLGWFSHGRAHRRRRWGRQSTAGPRRLRRLRARLLKSDGRAMLTKTRVRIIIRSNDRSNRSLFFPQIRMIVQSNESRGRMTMEPKTIFITGTSSGLGKLTAIRFARLGWQVAATMRAPEKETELQAYDNIRLFALDVTQPEQVRSAVEQAIEAFGKIDVVVNNAGIGVYGALELATEEQIDWPFAVNTRGAINVIRRFLPHFRANGGGMFVNISSFMGVTTAVPLGSLYNMSKFALEGLTEGLYYELKPLNIELRLIEQGGSAGNNFVTNTSWTRNEAVAVYDGLAEQVRQMMANASADPSRLDDPQIIVDAIEDVATGRSTQFRTLVGQAGQELMALRGSVPIEQYLETIAQSYR